MAKTKPTSNPTTRFTSSWDKQIPPTRRQAIKHEVQNRTPKTLWYGPNGTPATSLNKWGGKHKKAKHEANQHKDVQEQRNPSAGPPKQRKRILRPRADGAERIKLLMPVA